MFLSRVTRGRPSARAVAPLKRSGVLAAEEGTSISALLSGKLEQIIRERKAYDRSKKRALARLREGFDLQWSRPSSRDELHER